MKSEKQAACLKEVSHNVLDCGKTVTISNLSEDWGVTMKECSQVLKKLLDENSTAKFTKRYLLRGTVKTGSQHMTIVTEEKVDTWLQQMVKSSKMLYSVKVQSASHTFEFPKLLNTEQKRLVLSTNSLNRQICDVDSTKDVTLHAVCVKRESSDSQAAEMPAKKHIKNTETKSIASMFKNIKPEPKTPPKQQKVPNCKETSPKNKTPVKKSPINPSQKNLKKKVTTENVETKHETLKTNEGETEQTKNGNLNGKRSSIASEDSDDHKIALTPTPRNPQKKRKIANGKKVRSNGSRIIQMSDSSEDEGEKQREIAAEPTLDERKCENALKLPEENKNYRGKKRRIVTRTYEDEDGFIKTVKESEEYSTSEAEERSVIQVETKKEEAKKQTSPAKVVKPNATVKQGSIMSFFGKK